MDINTLRPPRPNRCSRNTTFPPYNSEYFFKHFFRYIGLYDSETHSLTTSESFHSDWQSAAKELSGCDQTLGILIERHKTERLQPSSDAFTTLANAIIGQQISVTAAAAIWERLVQRFPGKHLKQLNILQVEKANPADLKSCGLSSRKVEYVQGLCKAFDDGPFSENSWREFEDEKLIQVLSELHGIGRWTAQMFLIFHLGRLDILPLDDIGLLKAYARCYGADISDRKKLAMQAETHAEKLWRPFRTIATWYLWRELDPKPVAY